MKKHKILITSYSMNYGGIETSLFNLIKNIDFKKYEVTLVLERKEGVFLGELPKNINVLEYRVSEDKNIFIRKIKNLIKRIKWAIKNYNKYDTSICYSTYSCPGSAVARISAKNKIIYVHSNYCEIYKDDKNKIYEFFNSVKLDKYNHIVFVSNEARERLSEYYPTLKDNMTTINNLIDHNRVLDLSKEKIELDKKDNKVFLFIGRLSEQEKKITRIIESAKILKNEKIQFWIIGDGPDKEIYEELIKKYKLKNILLLGAKKNPYPYLKKSDYLLLTSEYEGFPVVYNEAIILNKPILTTIDVSDDYISIEGRFGNVVPKDVKEITKKIQELSKQNFKIKEKINFEELNEIRMKKIEELMEK